MTIKTEPNIIFKFLSDQPLRKCVKNNMLKSLRDYVKNIYIYSKNKKREKREINNAILAIKTKHE